MFCVIVVIYVICVKRPHQFLRTVGMFRETGPATIVNGSYEVMSPYNKFSLVASECSIGLASYNKEPPRESLHVSLHILNVHQHGRGMFLLISYTYLYSTCELRIHTSRCIHDIYVGSSLSKPTSVPGVNRPAS